MYSCSFRGLEGERQVVGQFGGFFHGSRLSGRRRLFPPDAGNGGLDLVLEAGDQLAVGGDQRLLGFDLRHDRLLRGEGWEGDFRPAHRRAKGPFDSSLGQRPRTRQTNLSPAPTARFIVSDGNGRCVVRDHAGGKMGRAFSPHFVSGLIPGALPQAAMEARRWRWRNLRPKCGRGWLGSFARSE